MGSELRLCSRAVSEAGSGSFFAPPAALRKGKAENKDRACLEWAGSLGFQNMTSESSPDLLAISILLSFTLKEGCLNSGERARGVLSSRVLSLYSKLILQDQNMQQLFTDLEDGDAAV